MTQNEALACMIMDVEQKKYPYYIITQIEILNTDQEKIEYRCKVSSKLDPKWSIWDSKNNINLSELVSKIRDEKISTILGD